MGKGLDVQSPAESCRVNLLLALENAEGCDSGATHGLETPGCLLV